MSSIWNCLAAEQCTLQKCIARVGAGDATLSVSCSDKLARWALLGCQGALLGELLCAPLHLAGLAVCVPACAAALRRAVDGDALYQCSQPVSPSGCARRSVWGRRRCMQRAGTDWDS